VSFLFLVKASIMPATSKAATKNLLPYRIKKSTRSKDAIKIKYSDKSPGQPQLIPIFEEIKNVGSL
jgi:hypothetical protein